MHTKRTALLAVLVLSLVLLSMGCLNERSLRRFTGSFPNTGAYSSDIFTEMHYQQSYRSQEPTRLAPPDGSVPIASGVRSPEEYLAMQMNGGTKPTTTAEEYAKLQNPVQRTPESLAKGKELYRVDCSMCHGLEAQGNGKVPVNAPNLISSAATNNTPAKADGHIYGIISEGGTSGLSSGNPFAMPKFKLLLSAEERWTLVNYVRQLQGN